MRDWINWQIRRERPVYAGFPRFIPASIGSQIITFCILSAHMVHTKARVHTTFTQSHSDAPTTDFPYSHPNVSHAMKRRE